MITLHIKGPYFMLISFALTEVIRLIYTRVGSWARRQFRRGHSASSAADTRSLDARAQRPMSER